MRKIIDKKEYHIVRDELTNLLEKTPQININPVNCADYNIKSLPPERMIYIDKSEMDNFIKFSEYDIRTYKIINYGKVAINLTFNTKHKYVVRKKLKKEEIQTTLNALISDHIKAIEKSEVERTPEDNASLGYDIGLLKKMIKNIENYEFCLSNFYKNYHYSTIAFRYKNEEGKFCSANSHLIKDLLHKKTNLLVEKRFNIVFVDLALLQERIPYANKEVEKYLKSFNLLINLGTLDFFAKLK